MNNLSGYIRYFLAVLLAGLLLALVFRRDARGAFLGGPGVSAAVPPSLTRTVPQPCT